MPQNNAKRWGLIAIAGAITLALILTVVGLISRQKDGPDESPSAATPAPVTTRNDRPQGKEGEWLDPTADVFGRSIKVPANGTGNPLGQAAVSESLNCQPTSSEITIEATHGTQTMWTKELGPSRLVEGDIPAGYAHSAEAAMVAGWNTTALVYRGGEVSAPAVEYGVRAEGADNLVRRMREKTPVADPEAKNRATPSAYRVTDCSEDHVIGDVALPMPTDAKGDAQNPAWQVLRMSMVWEENDWKLQLGQIPQPLETEITSLNGWTEWKY